MFRHDLENIQLGNNFGEMSLKTKITEQISKIKLYFRKTNFVRFQPTYDLNRHHSKTLSFIKNKKIKINKQNVLCYNYTISIKLEIDYLCISDEMKWLNNIRMTEQQQK